MGRVILKVLLSGYGRVIAVVVTLSLVGCTPTNVVMASQSNPDTAGHAFTKILAVGAFESLTYRRIAEKKLCYEINSDTEIECVESSQVFFPGQNYSSADVASRLANLHVDGILTLKPVSSGVSSAYVPPTSYTTWAAYISGNMVNGSATTQTFGGYSTQEPWINFEVILWSITDNKVAWYATASTTGHEAAQWDDLINATSEKAESDLLDDRVFKRRPEKPH